MKITQSVFVILIVSMLNLQCSLFDRKDNTIQREISDFDIKSRTQNEEAYKKRLLLLPILDANRDRDPELLAQVEKSFADQLNKSGELITLLVDELNKVKIELKKNQEYDLVNIAGQVKDSGVTTLVEGKVLDLRIRRKSDPIVKPCLWPSLP